MDAPPLHSLPEDSLPRRGKAVGLGVRTSQGLVPEWRPWRSAAKSFANLGAWEPAFDGNLTPSWMNSLRSISEFPVGRSSPPFPRRKSLAHLLLELFFVELRKKGANPRGKRKMMRCTSHATAKGLHTVQKAWMEIKVPQCGYCQTGQIMQAIALLSQNHNLSDVDIDTAMSGNLCCCGTFQRVGSRASHWHSAHFRSHNG